MKQKLFFLSFFLISIVIYLSCSKEQKTTPDSPQLASNSTQTGHKSLATATTVDTPSYVKQLVQDFHLQYLPSTFKGPAFSNYNDAAYYINNTVKKDTSTCKGLVGSLSASPATATSTRIKPYILPPSCNSAGLYQSSMNAGNLSSFAIDLSWSGTGITSADVYTTGLPIGWSWTQSGSSFSGSSGCIYGTLTWGIQVGSFTIGFIESWQFSISKNNCSLNYSEGPNVCFN